MEYFLSVDYVNDGVELDPISLGMVSLDGRELYVQFAGCDFTAARDQLWRTVMLWLDHFDFQRRGRSCERPGVDDFEYKGARCRHGRKEGGCSWRDRGEVVEMVRVYLDVLRYGEAVFWGYESGCDWVAFAQVHMGVGGYPGCYPRYCRDLAQYAEFLGLERYEPERGPKSLDTARRYRDYYLVLKGVEKSRCEVKGRTSSKGAGWGGC